MKILGIEPAPFKATEHRIKYEEGFPKWVPLHVSQFVVKHDEAGHPVSANSEFWSEVAMDRSHNVSALVHSAEDEARAKTNIHEATES